MKMKYSSEDLGEKFSGVSKKSISFLLSVINN